MIELLRNWLLGITAASIILALASNLMPDGTVKQIGKFAGGLFLTMAIIRPVLSADYEILAGSMAEYRMNTEEYSLSIEVENEKLKKIIIEDRTQAYIHDRAGELGIECCVTVQCGTNKEGQLYPSSAIIYGEMTSEQIKELTQIIESEIAIPREKQKYERTKDS